MKVVIIEGDASTREAIAEFLSREGCSPTILASLEDVKAILRKKNKPFFGAVIIGESPSEDWSSLPDLFREKMPQAKKIGFLCSAKEDNRFDYQITDRDVAELMNIILFLDSFRDSKTILARV